ncbi:glycerate kinase [Xylariaceae sp. FL0016]|nr:glycerate kinase [Xylariaceae sp. FL0016]
MTPSLRILIAPSGFKESLGPEQVAECIEEGIRRVLPPTSAVTRKVPLHDGGEGFCRALTTTQHGEIRDLRVQGPLNKPIDSHFGILPNKAAVLDMAAAAGLRLVPKDCRDPTRTTTFGVGELIAAALDEGCSSIIIGCGDSGTSDGGAGMLQALGAKLLDDERKELPIAQGGGSLSRLASVDLSNIHPRLRNPGDRVPIEAVCNTKNVLCGAKGVARVYGPQKGATPEQVENLSLALEKLAAAAKTLLGEEVGLKPGSGASGGLGTGLMLLGAQLRPRSDAVDEYFGLQSAFNETWDIVVSGEGSLDSQSAQGKMTVEVAKRAARQGAKVMILAGTIGDGAETLYEAGITSFTSIMDGPATLETAIQDADRLLKDAAERTIRIIQMGMAISPAPTSGAVLDKPKPLPLGVKANKPQRKPLSSMLKVARAMTG